MEIRYSASCQRSVLYNRGLVRGHKLSPEVPENFVTSGVALLPNAKCSMPRSTLVRTSGLINYPDVLPLRQLLATKRPVGRAPGMEDVVR
jgi:hypothetical protein